MIEVSLLGAGSRGMIAYGPYALEKPEELKFIAVAEPNIERRAKFAELHGIPAERQFASWEELLDQPKLSEAILICTMDADHFAPTMKALNKGYHVLLEKPMSPDPLEALEIAEEAERLGRILTVCHTMRYSDYYRALKKIVDSRAIGRIISIQWTENVGYWHQAHSFVRGNWRNSAESSPMILQKSCHDMDMLQWLIGGECVQVSSFGSLAYFNENNAPEGSTERCTDGCSVEHECPFSAIKLYHNKKTGFPQHVVSTEATLEARWKALQEGPYGRCVFRCDNDVVDHQVVNLLFDNEVTVAFTMTGFTNEVTRTFKIMGTEGEILGHEVRNEIEIIRFYGQRELINPIQREGGHGGADPIIMRDFVKQVQNNELQGISSGRESAFSHLIAFAAEHSRKIGKTVTMTDYIRELKESNASPD
jgi:predicted dehydrogenase